MNDMKRFEHKPVASFRGGRETASGTLQDNLKEMRAIVDTIVSDNGLATPTPQKQLYIGSLLYDYYLLAENCLLLIARNFDRWAPTSLDWRARLIKLMQNPVENLRPPILSSKTANMLTDFLMHYQNFNNQSSTTFVSRIAKLKAGLEQFQDQFEQEISFFARF